MAERRVHAILVAAGSGERFGGPTPKQLAPLGGSTVIQHAVGAFVGSGVVDEIAVVTRPDLVAHVTDLLGDSVDHVVEGGADRAGSVRAGLEAIGGESGDIVLVHDAARPLVAPARIVAVVTALDGANAVTVAVPARDTILEVDGGHVIDVPDRESLFRAQTPQGFRLGTLRAAHRAAAADASFRATDDCGVVRRFLHDVRIEVIPGSERNVKITTQADLDMAERLLGD